MSVIRCSVIAAAVLSVFVLCNGNSSAQNVIPSIPKVARSAPTPEEASGKIHLDVEVTGARDKPAGPLTEQQFTLLDNKEPRAITSFKPMSGTDDPVEVVIVVDSVNTPFIDVAYQRDQIAKYLRSNDGILPYPTTFAVLTDMSLSIYGKVSKNGGELAQALDNADIGLREISRRQGFYGLSDQLTISVNALSDLVRAEAKKPGRKLIMWVSPGWPLLSGPEMYLDSKQEASIYESVIDFSTEMRKGDITLYSLNSWGAGESLGRVFYYQSFTDGLKRPGDAQLGNLGLQVLAAQSGGLVLNTSDLVGMLKQSIADADRYYRLTFTTAPSDKPYQYHDLKIRLAAPGLTARTRTGYYSLP